MSKTESEDEFDYDESFANTDRKTSHKDDYSSSSNSSRHHDGRGGGSLGRNDSDGNGELVKNQPFDEDHSIDDDDETSVESSMDASGRFNDFAKDNASSATSKFGSERKLDEEDDEDEDDHYGTTERKERTTYDPRNTGGNKARPSDNVISDRHTYGQEDDVSEEDEESVSEDEDIRGTSEAERRQSEFGQREYSTNPRKKMEKLSEKEDMHDLDDDVAGEVKLYEPSDYKNLPVTNEIREAFQYIGRYKPHDIELETKLKCFIPDYIPSVGDIDAFIKIPRPDSKEDGLGLRVLDEPSTDQTEPDVLDLKLRAICKRSNLAPRMVKSIEHADKNTKAVEKWIESIENLHRAKPSPQVTYTKVMPGLEQLMQAWPEEFEEHLRNLPLPTPAMEMTLEQQVKIACALLMFRFIKQRVVELQLKTKIQ